MLATTNTFAPERGMISSSIPKVAVTALPVLNPKTPA